MSKANALDIIECFISRKAFFSKKISAAEADGIILVFRGAPHLIYGISPEGREFIAKPVT